MHHADEEKTMVPDRGYGSLRQDMISAKADP